MDGGGAPLRADVTHRLRHTGLLPRSECAGGRHGAGHREGPPVYDNAGKRLGEVDPASDRITRVIIRRGVLFHTETPIPAGWIAPVGDGITLSASANEAKELEPSAVGRPGTAHSR